MKCPDRRGGFSRARKESTSGSGASNQLQTTWTNVEEEPALDAPARRLVCDYWTRQWQKAYGFNFRRTMGEYARFWDNLVLKEFRTATFKQMLGTHPPCRSVTLLGDRRFRESTIVQEDVHIDQDTDSGVYLGHLFHAGSRISVRQRKSRDMNKQLKVTENTIEVVGGEEWRVCKNAKGRMFSRSHLLL